MTRVLALTCEEDPHADYVIAYLKQRGIDTYRVNTERLINDYSLSVRNGSFRIAGNGQTVHLDNAWTVWNRRVMPPDLSTSTPKELEAILRTETERTWDGLLFTHEGLVVNRPQAEYAANNKIDQLRFAQEYGFPVPDTLVSNDPAEAMAFYRSHPTICHKLQRVTVVERGGEHLISYTNIVKSDNLSNIESVRNHPTMFQAYIDKDYEVRITLTRSQVIPVAIHSQDSKISEIDYRKYDFENVRYQKITVPDHVTQFCHAIRDYYGLAFGTIDMIATKSGEFVFLELNPNGQWLWLELKTGYPLTAAVADNLTP